MEENEKKCFVHIDNYTGDSPIEIIYREDAPMQHLAPKDVKMPEELTIEGTIQVVYEWLSKRQDLVNIDNCHLTVDRDNAQIELVVNENNSRPALSEYDLLSAQTGDAPLGIQYAPTSYITGCIQFTEMYKKLHVNEDCFWDPVKLSKFLRLNRVIFADKDEGMALVSKLKNIKAKINGDYEKKKELHGQISKTEYFSQEVTHNLPQSFVIELAIFKGSPKEKYEIEIDADVIDGNIMVQFLSPAVNDDVEKVRDSLINEQIAKIQAICPNLVIVEI